MYVCVYVCIYYVRVYVYRYVYVCMYVCICVYVCMYVRTYVYIMYVCMYICMYVYMCVFVYEYLHMFYAQIYVCVCVWVCDRIPIWLFEKQVSGSYYCQPFRCVCNRVQSIQNIYYTEAPFFRSFLLCVSYVVHCQLSELYLMYQIYFRQWLIFSITLDKIIHFISYYPLLLFPCHAGQSAVTLSSADPGGRVI